MWVLAPMEVCLHSAFSSIKTLRFYNPVQLFHELHKNCCRQKHLFQLKMHHIICQPGRDQASTNPSAVAGEKTGMKGGEGEGKRKKGR